MRTWTWVFRSKGLRTMRLGLPEVVDSSTSLSCLTLVLAITSIDLIAAFALLQVSPNCIVQDQMKGLTRIGLDTACGDLSTLCNTGILDACGWRSCDCSPFLASYGQVEVFSPFLHEPIW